MEHPPQRWRGLWRECSIGLVRKPLLGLLLLAICPTSAAATPVVVLGPHGRAVVRDDPFLSGRALTPEPSSSTAGARAASARKPAPRRGKPKQPQPTVVSELARLYRTRAITRAADDAYSASFAAALATERRLNGTRATELDAVTENLHQIAAAGALTPSRLPVLFQTLDRNRQWWTTGPLLSPGQRVEFSGSPLVWEYYAGQGIELQVLGTFGKADALYGAGPVEYPQLESLLAQMVPLAASRGGGLTWEYYFNFDGGLPPWTSAMSQATGLEALTRAYLATGSRYYLSLAHTALPIFSTPPPVGVNVETALGIRYLQYSFAPGTAIINAFLQSLIGLYDYAHVSGDPQAAALFAAGDAEARAEVPRYDTGAWSLYQPGVEDSLSYHTLVTGFLAQLCQRTAAPVYCTTADHFQAYLTTPPALSLLTASARVDRPATIRFRLSKYSHVGIVVVRGMRTTLLTSGEFAYGVHSFLIPPLNGPGQYTVRLAATDLAGNFTRIAGTLTVSR
jgi:hypothetical protein